MKTLKTKNIISFESKEEMEQYIENNELICLAQVGRYSRYSYINSKTELSFGYLRNLYVIDVVHFIARKHPRLYTYWQANGGWYVKSQGEKCWINSFWDKTTGLCLSGKQVIENLKKERGV